MTSAVEVHLLQKSKNTLSRQDSFAIQNKLYHGLRRQGGKNCSLLCEQMHTAFCISGISFLRVVDMQDYFWQTIFLGTLDIRESGNGESWVSGYLWHWTTWDHHGKCACLAILDVWKRGRLSQLFLKTAMPGNAGCSGSLDMLGLHLTTGTPYLGVETSMLGKALL